MNAETVHVVEDEPLLLDIAAAELQDAGLTVIPSLTSDHALEILRSDAVIDILFTDIRLAGSVDGWVLAEIARELRPQIKVIYATGFSMEKPRLVPGSKFFNKPYSPSAILAAIGNLRTASPEMRTAKPGF